MNKGQYQAREVRKSDLKPEPENWVYGNGPDGNQDALEAVCKVIE